MLETKQKAEIQALSAFGFQYVTEEYLPRKIKEGDWLRPGVARAARVLWPEAL